MKVVVDTFLKGENLNGATSKNPIEGTIQNVKFIEVEDLGFPSDSGRYELRVLVNGTEYDWLSNKTSLRSFVSAFGDDSDSWLDKKIKLFSVEQNVGGKIKQVIYATA